MCVVDAHLPTVCSWRTTGRLRLSAQRSPDDAAHRSPTVLIEGFDRHYRLFRATSARRRSASRQAPGRSSSTRCRSASASTTSASRECVDRLRAEFDVDALDRRDLARGEAPLHRPARRAQPARARRDVLQLGDQADPAAHLLRQRPDLRPRRDLDRVHRVRPADLPQLLPERRRGAASASRSCSATSAGAGRSPTSTATSTACSRALAERPGGPWHAPRAELPDPGAPLGLLPQQGRLRVRQARQRPRASCRSSIPVLHDADGRLEVDAILLDPQLINILFSLSRAYFMVDMEVPSGLRRVPPLDGAARAGSELYTMVGLGKQGKTLFFRELRQHLHHSRDQFVEAPGIRGQVMLVFTLPSFPYVFKVIRDRSAARKDTDRATVRAKFEMVKHVDRVGRLADTLEFVDLALPRERFSPELLAQLRELAPSMIVRGRPARSIRHCYVERRMVPLNLYLDRATPRRARGGGRRLRQRDPRPRRRPTSSPATCSGGTSASRATAASSSTTTTRSSTSRDVNFRRIPAAPDDESELAAEPWYGVMRTTSSRRSSRPSCSATRACASFPAPPRRPARAGVLAGRPAPDRERRGDRLLPVPGVAPLSVSWVARLSLGTAMLVEVSGALWNRASTRSGFWRSHLLAQARSRDPLIFSGAGPQPPTDEAKGVGTTLWMIRDRLLRTRGVVGSIPAAATAKSLHITTCLAL